MKDNLAEIAAEQIDELVPADVFAPANELYREIPDVFADLPEWNEPNQHYERPEVSVADRLLMTEQMVADSLSVSRATLRRWRRTEEGPAWIKLGAKAVRYRRRDLDQFLELQFRKRYSADSMRGSCG